jgi:hypothetical protein
VLALQSDHPEQIFLGHVLNKPQLHDSTLHGSKAARTHRNNEVQQLIDAASEKIDSNCDGRADTKVSPPKRPRHGPPTQGALSDAQRRGRQPMLKKSN